ncbi:hypothetical protein BKA93DRAFT_446306 [Sparassis latifolia]
MTLRLLSGGCALAPFVFVLGLYSPWSLKYPAVSLAGPTTVLVCRRYASILRLVPQLWMKHLPWATFLPLCPFPSFK